jgi:MATE family multidrug resistance protein
VYTPSPRVVIDESVSEPRAMLYLAAPLAVQQVGNHLMGLVDAAMLGRYSDAALAGAGVGNNLYFAITCIGLGIIMGMDTIVPQALGAGRTDDARRAVGAGLRLAVLVGLLTTLVVFGSPFILKLADVQPEVLHEARAFIYMRALGAVPFLGMVALRSYLAAHGKTRPLVLAVVLGNLANVGLDLALIYGVPALGIPSMGVLGAALATTFVQSMMLLVYWLAVRAIDAGSPRPRSTSADMRAIFVYGGPVGGQLFLEVGIFGVATVMCAHIGKLAAGAHSIALNLSSLTFAFALGVASATSVRVGHAVGAGDLALARRRGLIGLELGLAVMACFAATFLLVPRLLAGLFTAEAAMVASTIPLLQIAALFQLSDGAQAVTAGALRGLGDTRATMIGNLVGHYIVGLPLILALAFGLGLGAPGIWFGLSAGLTGTALYLIARFLAGTRTQK